MKKRLTWLTSGIAGLLCGAAIPAFYHVLTGFAPDPRGATSRIIGLVLFPLLGVFAGIVFGWRRSSIVAIPAMGVGAFAVSVALWHVRSVGVGRDAMSAGIAYFAELVMVGLALLLMASAAVGYGLARALRRS